MEHTAAMLMLCVTTSADHITARAKMDFMEMESTALVTISIAPFGSMKLARPVEPIVKKSLIFSDIGKVSKVTLYDLYVRQ